MDTVLRKMMSLNEDFTLDLNDKNEDKEDLVVEKEEPQEEEKKVEETTDEKDSVKEDEKKGADEEEEKNPWIKEDFSQEYLDKNTSNLYEKEDEKEDEKEEPLKESDETDEEKGSPSGEAPSGIDEIGKKIEAKIEEISKISTEMANGENPNSWQAFLKVLKELITIEH